MIARMVCVFLAALAALVFSVSAYAQTCSGLDDVNGYIAANPTGCYGGQGCTAIWLDDGLGFAWWAATTVYLRYYKGVVNGPYCPNPAEGAGDTAAAAAAARGMTAGAQSAAEAEASSTYSAWIAASRSVEDATEAAAIAGELAANQYAMAEITPQYDAAIANVVACYNNTPGPSCDALMQPYYDARTAAGLDQWGARYTITINGGGYVEYQQADGASGWHAFEYDAQGEVVKFIGMETNMLPIDPVANTAVPWLGGVGGLSGGGSVGGAATGTAATVPGVQPPPGPAKVSVPPDAPATVSYPDAGGSIVCVATRDNLGNWTLSGAGCSGANPGAVASGTGLVPAGGTTGTGDVGTVATILQSIYGLLDPSSVTQAQRDLTAPKTALDSAAGSAATEFTTQTGRTELGFGLSVTWPVASCTNPSFSMPGGRGTLTVPMCEHRDDIQTALNWLVVVFSLFTIFSIGIGAVGGKK